MKKKNKDLSYLKVILKHFKGQPSLRVIQSDKLNTNQKNVKITI